MPLHLTSFIILFICCHGVSDGIFSNTAFQNYKILVGSAAGKKKSKLLFKAHKCFFFRAIISQIIIAEINLFLV